MTPDKQQAQGQEDKDQNNQEPHDPAAAGKKAIEASRLSDESGKSSAEQRTAEEKDADQWRNEG